jgi:hypothetical protein
MDLFHTNTVTVTNTITIECPCLLCIKNSGYNCSVPLVFIFVSDNTQPVHGHWTQHRVSWCVATCHTQALFTSSSYSLLLTLPLVCFQHILHSDSNHRLNSLLSCLKFSVRSLLVALTLCSSHWHLYCTCCPLAAIRPPYITLAACV